ncbi:PREDICTED: BTB/POZ and MATH domain-containing protein 4-like [Erythranthe guttata]|nr:PREDICTED: BTB/POZ and MATH domain-containing protein 4-like [Erythranthe guttata]|eukprot:XP_012855552.1 PREDICTED: BTB/POZ and MATH domain-containing protein 4-like [Erythranthe guttata]
MDQLQLTSMFSDLSTQEDVETKSASQCLTRTVKGIHLFTLENYSLCKGVGYGNPICSNTFTVAGYQWVVFFFPDRTPSEMVELSLKEKKWFHFLGMLETGEGSDVTFIVGGMKFRAHRVIVQHAPLYLNAYFLATWLLMVITGVEPRVSKITDIKKLDTFADLEKNCPLLHKELVDYLSKERAVLHPKQIEEVLTLAVAD